MSQDSTGLPGARYTSQTVLDKVVWVPGQLFSLRVTRDPDYRFTPGQFARIGLPIAGGAESGPTPEWRAYSMVSRADEDALEFYSVVVPDGKFSPALARLVPGDTLLVDKTAFGFLTLERFVDGEDLWLIATGTGLSAYLSMLRDPTTWQRFSRVVLVHGVRHTGELAYRAELLDLVARHSGGQSGLLTYLPVTSREATNPFLFNALRPDLLSPARITSLLESGELEQRVGLSLDGARSRVMLCGNPAMVTDLRAMLGARGFAAGRRGVAGNLAVENYW